MEKSKECNINNDNIEQVNKRDKKEYEPGLLSLFRKMNKEQYEVFHQQLADNYSYKLDTLRNILNDDAKFLQILDAFADTNISFPSRKQMYQILDRTYIYIYVRDHGFTEESYRAVAKNFGEKLATVKSRTLRTSKVLNGAEYTSLIREQEKLKAQRRAKREENKRKRAAEAEKLNEKENNIK